MQQKGFTLIELLIVIAIIAVLSVVVVLTLNPAELLRQARDSTRISDMSSLNSALSLFLADGGVFTMGPNCFAATSTPGNCVTIGFTSNAVSSTAIVVTSTRGTSGNDGWMRGVDFSSISSGAPFGVLPVDPTNSQTLFYGFAVGNSSTYKLNSRMESTKYSTGTSAVGVNDGGTSSTLYEVGNTLSL